MFELLSLIFGGALRLVPEVLGYFKQRQEHAHELEMTKLQLDIDKARASQAIDLAHAQAEIAANAGEMQAWADSIRAQATPSGIRWIDALSSSVRPVLTYWWVVGLYGSAKVIGIVVAIDAHAKLSELTPLLIGEFDRTVIGSILSFWFVDRALRKRS